MLGTSAISLREEGIKAITTHTVFALMLLAFTISITTSIYVMSKGLKAEKEEGFSSNSISQRNINRSKFKGLQISSFFAIAGFVLAAAHIFLLSIFP